MSQIMKFRNYYNHLCLVQKVSVSQLNKTEIFISKSINSYTFLILTFTYHSNLPKEKMENILFFVSFPQYLSHDGLLVVFLSCSLFTGVKGRSIHVRAQAIYQPIC